MKCSLSELNADSSSQLFGEVEMPEEWLERDVFAPCEFFLCKLDMSVFGGGLLPDCGYLYVFIDMPTTIEKAKVVVRYTSSEPDASTDFNDGFFDEEPEPAAITASGNSGVGAVVNEREGFRLTIISLSGKYLPEELGKDRLTVSVAVNQDETVDFLSASLTF